MTIPQNEEKPRCFGVEDNPPGNGWNPRSPECGGGPDPAYTNPENGSHIREKCVFFEACGTKVQAKKMEGARTLLDPKSLVRQQQPVYAQPPAQSAPKTFPQPVQQQVPQQQPSFIEKFALALYNQQQNQAQLATQQQPKQIVQPQSNQPQPQQPQAVMVQPPPNMHPPTIQQMMAQQHQLPVPMMPYGYQVMMPVNHQMPGYLTVPEVRHPNQGFWSFFGLTIARSMMKSAGHSIAHLFDTVPLGYPSKGPGESGGGGG